MLWKLWIVTAGLLSLSFIVIVILAVRRVVLDVLTAKQKLQRKEIIRRLLPILSDPDTGVGSRKVTANKHLLADVGCELLNLVRGEERQRYAKVLAQVGVKDALLEQLDRRQNVKRIYAAEALAAFSADDAKKMVRRLLNDCDPEVRLAGAIAALAQDEDIDLKQLLRNLGSGSSNSRRLVQLFKDVASRSPFSVLEIAVDTTMDVSNRSAAIEALGALRELSAAQFLLRLADPASELQMVSIQALGAIGHPIAKDVITAGLYSLDWEVRAASAEAAGRIGLKQTIVRLAELLDDSNWWVRLRAGNALIASGSSGEHVLRTIAADTTARAGRMAAIVLAERVNG